APHALANLARQVLDLLQGVGRDIQGVTAHANSPSTSSHFCQPARLRLPLAAFSSAKACRAIWTSSSVSSHSIRASQSSALTTAKRLPFFVTNCTACRASSPGITRLQDDRKGTPIIAVDSRQLRAPHQPAVALARRAPP